jgi:hypothetical protein
MSDIFEEIRVMRDDVLFGVLLGCAVCGRRLTVDTACLNPDFSDPNFYCEECAKQRDYYLK